MAFKISEAARKRAGAELRLEQKARSMDLRRRLVALVAEHGPDSLYADMLASHDERHNLDGSHRD